MKTKILAGFLILLVTVMMASSQQFTEGVSSDSLNSSNLNSNEIPAGTILSVAFDSEISSANASVNDTFVTTLIEPLIVNGVSILPAKTIVHGRIVKVEKASRGGKAGKLEVIFDRIELRDGTFRSIKGEAKVLNLLKGKSAAPINAGIIGGGIGIGAAVGAGASGGSKSLLGGLLGGGIGIGAVLLTKGNEAVLKANSRIGIEIKEKVILPTTDY